MSTLSPVTFSSAKPGPRFLITGAVHGNEPCGHVAIGRVLKHFEQKEIEILRGSVTMVQTCNPQAFQQKTRYVESDLNRNLFYKETPQTYEDTIGNQLCALLNNTDFLLDIHSYRCGGPAFGYISPARTTDEIALLSCAGAAYGAFGFAESYKAANIKIDPQHAMGTREYLISKGGYGITLECGQHDAPESVEVAYRAILNTLSRFGLIRINAQDLLPEPPPAAPHIIHVQRVVYKEKNGQMIKSWKNFEPISKDDVITRYDDGEELASPIDGVIVMPDPRPDMPVDEEWFYIGVPVS